MNKMNKKFLLALFVGFAFLSSLISVGYTQAAIYDYHYYITATPSVSVSLGSSVTITVTSDNPDVDTVEFNWYAQGQYPTGTPHTDSIYIMGPNSLSHQFNSTYTLTSPGTWTVTATLSNQLGKPIETITATVTVVTSVFVLPETPVIGAAGATIASLAAVATLQIRQKRRQKLN
jgi:hypothetical protein